MDLDGNSSAASGQGAGTVSADPLLPRLAFSAPTPASASSVSGTVSLQADATPPSTTSSVSYGFDPAGFRRSRTVASQTTRFLLGGLIETTTSGTITGFDVDGPAGDLAHYTTAPSSAVNPSYSYYTGHGDLAAEADQTGTRTRLIRLDLWGQPLSPPGGSDLQELFTGRWDKKHDQVSSLIEMGARPYDPALGRFLSVDPIDGGSANEYEYALQDPINAYDLSGKWCVIAWGTTCSPAARRARATLHEVGKATVVEVRRRSRPYVGPCVASAAVGLGMAWWTGGGLVAGPVGGCLVGAGQVGVNRNVKNEKVRRGMVAVDVLITIRQGGKGYVMRIRRWYEKHYE